MTSLDPGTTRPDHETGPGSQSRTGSPTVAVVATTPVTAVADMARAMDLAGVGEFLSPEIKTFLKVAGLMSRKSYFLRGTKRVATCLFLSCGNAYSATKYVPKMSIFWLFLISF